MQDLFERYAQSILGAPETVVPLCDFPFVIVDEGGCVHLFDQEALVVNMTALQQRYQTQGVNNVQHNVLLKSQKSQDVQQVRVEWQFLRDGQPLYQCETEYLLKAQWNQLKIIAVIMCDEATAWQRLDQSQHDSLR